MSPAPQIKLIQLNVEGHRHLGRILPFLEKERADVVCFQELQERDIPALKEVVGSYAVFIPVLRRAEADGVHLEGTGIISRFPISANGAQQYAGATTITKNYDNTNIETKRDSERFMLVHADVEKEGMRFRIATTHFTWTPDGKADEYQRGDIQALFSVLLPLGECVLTGDFNAPRGGEIFSLLAGKFKDNVPPHYTTSIDGTLHRAGPLEHMVDGIFTSPPYSASKFEMKNSVSDHCALVAYITRAVEV